MTSDPIKIMTRKVLNDPDIFSRKYDPKQNTFLPELFPAEEWEQLRRASVSAQEFAQLIATKEQELDTAKYQLWKEEFQKRLTGLQDAYANKRPLFDRLLENLDCYAIVECQLPTMDEYGRIIEEAEIGHVENFFRERIRRQRDRQGVLSTRGKSLERVLVYVLELYQTNASLDQMAFFVRTLNGLQDYWRVIS